MTDRKTHRPGDILLDRYFPDADEAMRELVRERLQRLMNIAYRILARRVREQDSAREGGRPILRE